MSEIKNSGCNPGEWTTDLYSVRNYALKKSESGFFIGILMDQSDESKTAWQKCFDNSKFRKWCEENQIALLYCDNQDGNSESTKMFRSYLQKDLELPCIGVFDGLDWTTKTTYPTTFGIDTFRDKYMACGRGVSKWTVNDIPTNPFGKHVAYPIRSCFIDIQKWKTIQNLVYFYIGSKRIKYDYQYITPTQNNIRNLKAPYPTEIVPNEENDQELKEIGLWHNSNIPCVMNDVLHSLQEYYEKYETYSINEYIEENTFQFYNNVEGQKYEIKITTLSSQQYQCYLRIDTDEEKPYVGHEFVMDDMLGGVVFPAPVGNIYIVARNYNRSSRLNDNTTSYYKFTIRKISIPDSGGKWEYIEETTGDRKSEFGGIISYSHGATPGVWSTDYQNIMRYSKENHKPFFVNFTKAGGCGLCHNWADGFGRKQNFLQKMGKLGICLGESVIHEPYTSITEYSLSSWFNLKALTPDVDNKGNPIISRTISVPVSILYSPEENEILSYYVAHQSVIIGRYVYEYESDHSKVMVGNRVYFNKTDSIFDHISMVVQMTNETPLSTEIDVKLGDEYYQKCVDYSKENNIHIFPKTDYENMYRIRGTIAEKVVPQEKSEKTLNKIGVFYNFEKITLNRKNYFSGDSYICGYDIQQHWYKFSGKAGKYYRIGIKNLVDEKEIGEIGAYVGKSKVEDANKSYTAAKDSADFWMTMKDAVANNGLVVNSGDKDSTIYILFTRRDVTKQEKKKDGQTINLKFYFTLQETDKPEEPPQPVLSNDLSSQIVSLNISDSVLSIGDYSFRNCQRLASVGGGSGIVFIGTEAFANDSSLNRFERFEDGKASNTFEIVGDRAFYGTALQKVNLSLRGSSIYTFWGDYCFANNDNLREVNFLSSSYMSNNMFCDCHNLTSVTFQNDYTSYVFPYVFHNCSSLTAITLPSKLWYVSENMFDGCSNLRSVTFSDYGSGSKCNLVQRSAFNGCSELTSIEFPESIDSLSCLEDGCFSNIPKLSQIRFNGISYEALNGNNLTGMDYNTGKMYMNEKNYQDIIRCAEANEIPILYCHGYASCETSVITYEKVTEEGETVLCSEEIDVWTTEKYSKEFEDNYRSGSYSEKLINQHGIFFLYTSTGQFRKCDGETVQQYLEWKHGDKVDGIQITDGSNHTASVNSTNLRKILNRWKYSAYTDSSIEVSLKTGKMYIDDSNDRNIVKFAKERGVPILFCFGGVDNVCNYCNTFKDNYKTDFTEESNKIKDINIFFVYDSRGSGAMDRNRLVNLLPDKKQRDGRRGYVIQILYWISEDGKENAKLLVVNDQGEHYTKVKTEQLLSALSDIGYEGEKIDETQYIDLENIYRNGCFRLNHDVTIVDKDGTSINYVYDQNRVEQYVDPIKYESDSTTKKNFKNGTWYYNARQMKEQADSTGTPLLCIYSLLGCDPCRIYKNNIWDNEIFQKWAAKQKFLLCGMDVQKQAYYDKQLDYCTNEWSREALNYVPYGESSELSNAFGQQFHETIDADGRRNSDLFTPVIVFYHRKTGEETPGQHYLYTFHNISQDIRKNGVEGVIKILERLCLYHFDGNDLENARYCVGVDKAFELSDVGIYTDYRRYDSYYDETTGIMNLTTYGTLEKVSSTFKDVFGYGDYVGGCSMAQMTFFGEIGITDQNVEEWNDIVDGMLWKIDGKYYHVSFDLQDSVEVLSKCSTGYDTLYRIKWEETKSRKTVDMTYKYATLQEMKDDISEYSPETEGQYIGGCILSHVEMFDAMGLTEETLDERFDYFNQVLGVYEIRFGDGSYSMQLDGDDTKTVDNPCSIDGTMTVYRMQWTPSNTPG